MKITDITKITKKIFITKPDQMAGDNVQNLNKITTFITNQFW
jgi:hypothetical protein